MSHLSVGCAKDDGGTCCGMCGYTPVVIMATHHRISITTYNIKTLISYGIPNMKIVLAATDPGELSYYRSRFPYIHVIDSPNVPLGAKWQSAVGAAKKLGANPLIILGSDDLITKEYIERGLRLLTAGHDFVGMSAWYVHDDIDNKTYRCRYVGRAAGRSVGSGRIVSRQLLDHLRWLVFDSSATRRLDDRLEFLRINKSIVIDDPGIISIKGDWKSMNPVSKILRADTVESIEITQQVKQNLNRYVSNMWRSQPDNV